MANFYQQNRHVQNQCNAETINFDKVKETAIKFRRQLSWKTPQPSAKSPLSFN